MDRRQALMLLGSTAITSRFAAAAPAKPLYPRTRAYLKGLIDTGQCNGNIDRVFRNGHLELNDTQGWMDAGHTIPMRRDAIFSIASMSKPITAVSIMVLVEQGKIKLHDPIDKWIPELANRKVLRDPSGPLDNTYPSPRPITVADLLAFRMGLGTGGPPGPIAQAVDKANPLVPVMELMTWDAWLKGLGELPLQFAPGERWLYNTSADVLSAIIYRITGAQPHKFMEEHLFGPLDMKDTSFMPAPDQKARLAGWPAGYERLYVASTPQLESGAAGLYSTADDYMAFARMLLNRGTLNGKRILQPSSIDRMTVNTLKPADLASDKFSKDLAGWGYGYTVAVRLAPMADGPSVGSFNWDGSTGVWFMVDPKQHMVSLLMIQHPRPGVAGHTDPSAATKYLTLKQLHDPLQTAIYKDVASA